MGLNLLCIYHANCADGFTAAWAVRQALGEDNVDFHAGVHQDPPPDVTGRDVLLVDFSYKRHVLDQIAQVARSILILDHHKSAAEDLAPFAVTESEPGRLKWDDVPGLMRDLAEMNRPPVAALFDMERSGAMLAWQFFHDSPPPALVRHVEDRDLWRFALPNTREIQAAVFSYEYTFANWDALAALDPAVLADEGRVIERKHFKDIREFIAAAARRMTIAGHDVPVLNAPYFWSSDAGHMLADGEPFAACYWDTPEGRVFSLRSTESAVDVSAVAALFGGGGHKHAAGFRIPWERVDHLMVEPA